MKTSTGNNTRTISGYVESLLEYPRWVIERDVDFTNCRFHGTYTASADRCTSCLFGEACRWLNLAHVQTSGEDPLSERIAALKTAADYLLANYGENHKNGCTCETCSWLRQVRRFLHSR